MRTMHAGEAHKTDKPPFAFLSRYIPLAVIAVIMIMLIPQLIRREPVSDGGAGFEPPVALTVYRTERARMDSLSNEGLRYFSAERWNDAVRLLGEAHFHYSVMIREGFEDGYPDDLRFYLGLAHYYRGQATEGIALLEEEAENDPLEPKYRWYLALIRLAGGETQAAREDLKQIVRLGGEYSEEAGEMLGRIGTSIE
jgi:tetratricopeptide (TPR) repeat protein